VNASLGFDAGIASANVQASLIGSLKLNLEDPNNDGKVRLKELSDEFNLGPLCIFKITGALDAQLSAHASFGISPADVSLDAESPLINLLSFDHECNGDPQQSDPILATVLPGNTLRLNMGPYTSD